MSFPRHERSIVRWDHQPKAEQPAPLPISHRLDESQLDIPWQVALQQSLPPLHQPVSSSCRPAETVNLTLSKVGEFSTGEMRKFQPALTLGRDNHAAAEMRAALDTSAACLKMSLHIIDTLIADYQRRRKEISESLDQIERLPR